MSPKGAMWNWFRTSGGVCVVSQMWGIFVKQLTSGRISVINPSLYSKDWVYQNIKISTCKLGLSFT